MRTAKVQASLHICAVSPEPSLLAHRSSESRGTFRQKARSVAPLNGWACADEICHDKIAWRHKFAWRGSCNEGMEETCLQEIYTKILNLHSVPAKTSSFKCLSYKWRFFVCFDTINQNNLQLVWSGLRRRKYTGWQQFWRKSLPQLRPYQRFSIPIYPLQRGFLPPTKNALYTQHWRGPPYTAIHWYKTVWKKRTCNPMQVQNAVETLGFGGNGRVYFSCRMK